MFGPAWLGVNLSWSVRVRRQVPALTSHSFTYIGDVWTSMAWGQLVMVSEVGRQVPALTSHSFTYIRDVRDQHGLGSTCHGQ
jgi:hypothetical protein